MVSPRKTYVLEKLADAGERGSADNAFVSRFTPELLDLVMEQFVSVEREVKVIGGWPLDFARVRITDKGRQLIENEKRASISRYERMRRGQPAQTAAA